MAFLWLIEIAIDSQKRAHRSIQHSGTTKKM